MTNSSQNKSNLTQLLGFNIRNDSADSIVSEIVNVINEPTQSAKRKWFACINPHSYVEIKKRPELIEPFKSADWIVPDGSGIVLAAQLSGKMITERVTGADIFFGLMGRLNGKEKKRIFFLGSTEETLSKIKEKFEIEYPDLEFAGSHSPPYKPIFSEQDTHAMIEAVNNADTDILWVGMTAPKQESWIADNLQHLNIDFAGAIGAVFDFYIGNVRRSPEIFQKYHLEWLPRLVQQPKRLWRRTFVSAPIFVKDVFFEKLSTRKSTS